MTVEIERLWFIRGHADDHRQPDAGRLDIGACPVSVFGQPESAQRLFESWGSINSKVPAWGSLSWYFDILDILVSLNKHLPLIYIIDSSS